ncbi:hypothetical protein DIE19_34765 [Burkholderia sp. Bp9126]|nr:hypothetical protein DIE19_34765 [Burkholderia sp. Bp9126]
MQIPVHRQVLLDNKNKIVSRWAIQRAVWRREFEASSRPLETHIPLSCSKPRLDEDQSRRIIPAYVMGCRLVLCGAAMINAEPGDAAFPTS